jgi:RNA polymerase sigma-70 factor (ECF subfamily)
MAFAAARAAEFGGTLRAVPAITHQMPAKASGGTVDTSDRDLVRRTAAGDREAFADLYRRHHAAVYRFARLMTGSGALAEDVVQEVFLVLMRSASRYDPDRSTLSTYLYGVARQYTRRRLARERRFVPFEEHDRQERRRGVPGDWEERRRGVPENRDSRFIAFDPGPVDVEHRQELRRLRCAILSLPSRYREVVVLCDLHDVTYADAAASIGCAVGTIRSRLHRARQLLGDKMRRSAVHESRAAGAAVRCAV